jgi:hypothetical protein
MEYPILVVEDKNHNPQWAWRLRLSRVHKKPELVVLYMFVKDHPHFPRKGQVFGSLSREIKSEWGKLARGKRTDPVKNYKSQWKLLSCGILNPMIERLATPEEQIIIKCQE